MKYAVLSDIHGNVCALKKVLEHIRKSHVDKILCLGDVFYGPINPREVHEELRSLEISYVQGNMDEFLLNKDDDASETKKFILNELNTEALEMIAKWPMQTIIDKDIFMCHGSKKSKTEYLIEKVEEHKLVLKEYAEIEHAIGDISQPIILCGHSHIPRVVEVSSGQIIINPGSVGMPCFESENSEGKYASENGASFAKYATIEVANGQLQEVSHHSIKYEVAASVKRALDNNRPDYAAWVKTGFKVNEEM